MPTLGRRGTQRIHATTAGKVLIPYGWTLDGWEATRDHRAYIVRSCPRCRVEQSAPADDIPALDDLREWAFGHSAYCVANEASIVSSRSTPVSFRARSRASRCVLGATAEAFA